MLDRTFTIGTPEEFAPEEARAIAAKALAEAKAGRDPAAARTAPSVVTTLRDLVALYREQALPDRKPSTQRSYAIYLRDLSKRWGSLAVGSLTRDHLDALRVRMRSKPVTFNRTRAMVSGLYAFAIARGIVDENPAARVKPYPEMKRRRYLSDDETARLGKALREAARLRTEDPSVLAAFELLLLTGCRRSELCGARRTQLDVAARTLVLPDTKNGTSRTVALSDAALAVLKALPPRPGEWLLPAPGDWRKPARNLSKPWARLCKAAGIPAGRAAKGAGLRIHDLRHSHASMLLTAGYSLGAIGECLGHKSTQTTQRYAHLNDASRRAAAASVDARITAAFEIPAERPRLRRVK